jgi:predicted short-subunit dehydrogenase-like oxidoreductase (DUF2520 family)
MRVGIVGAGAVGTAIGLLLRRQGYEIIGVVNRTVASTRRAALCLETQAFVNPSDFASQADLLFITTSDQAIAGVVRQIAAAGGFCDGQTVVHTSGSLKASIMQPAADAGARIVSIHPLQSCPSPEQAVQNLPNAVFSIEGDPAAFPIAEKLVQDLGGIFFYIDPEVKPLYHAAACVASNYLVSLIDLSQRFLSRAGMPDELLTKGIMPLIQGTLRNITEIGIPLALTGPISRGDVGTVAEHLQVISRELPHLLGLYNTLAQHTVSLARDKGTISNLIVKQMDNLLKQGSLRTEEVVKWN